MEILLAIAIAVVVALFIGWLISVRPDPPDTVLMNNPEYWLDKDIKDLEQALAITPQSGKIDEDMDEDMSVHDEIGRAHV